MDGCSINARVVVVELMALFFSREGGWRLPISLLPALWRVLLLKGSHFEYRWSFLYLATRMRTDEVLVYASKKSCSLNGNTLVSWFVWSCCDIQLLLYLVMKSCQFMRLPYWRRVVCRATIGFVCGCQSFLVRSDSRYFRRWILSLCPCVVDISSTKHGTMLMPGSVYFGQGLVVVDGMVDVVGIMDLTTF